MKFSVANAKIQALSSVEGLSGYLEGKRKVYSFDLLSGHSCPFAEQCLSKVIIQDGKRKIKDGPKTEFRCFSASQESIYTNLYNLRKSNYDELRAIQDDSAAMADAIIAAMPKNAGIVRIHVGGDFFNENYFKAWIIVATLNPDRLFYAYTKSLKYWVNQLQPGSEFIIPDNLVLTASRGGRLDHLIAEYNLREAVVVYSEEAANKLNLKIDHDDSHAATRGGNFALLIHGAQPKGSEASEALQQLKKNKVKHSYSRKAVTA